MTTRLSFIAAALVALVTTAQAAPARLAIADFRGPRAERIQGAAESALMARYYVVPDFSVRRAARENQVELQTDSDYGVVGRTLEVKGFLSAQVLQKRASWEVRLQVRRGDTGEAVGSFVLADRRLDGLESRVARLTPARVHRLLARLDRAAPATESAPEETAVEPPPTTVVETAAPPMAAEDEMPFAELSVEGRVFSRSFNYAQNLSGLPDYRLARALSAALDLTLYPHALLSRQGQLPPIGLTAALEYAPGVRSRAAGGDQALATRVHAYRVGLKYRLSWSTVTLAPQLAWGRHAFQTGGTAAPDVRYQFLWLGADSRWLLGRRLALLASAAYLHGLSVGELGEAGRFPRATAAGAAVELGAAFTVARGIELRLSGGLRRFGLAMHARPGDALVAGGAVDQLTWAGLGLAYRPAVRP
jgi:hypothetical protein